MSAAAGSRHVGAFFDVDGTLVPPPSLERRFFASPRRRRAIPVKNYFLWLAHAFRLMPQGIAMIQHGDKMYLRGVRAAEIEEKACGEVRGNLFGPAGIPLMSEMAFDRLVWHATQEHAIVLVTGTLAPLARTFALHLVIKLAARRLTASIGVCATELEEVGGRWTGRIIGEAIFGEAKARAVQRVARELGLDLARSHAYGDSASDRWMLEAVGRPTTVNPSPDLARIARRKDWPVLWWDKRDKGPTLSAQSTPSSQRNAEVFARPGDLG